MIEIKAYISGWREVPREKAAEFVWDIIRHPHPNLPNGKLAEWIECYHLRGITVKELTGWEAAE